VKLRYKAECRCADLIHSKHLLEREKKMSWITRSRRHTKVEIVHFICNNSEYSKKVRGMIRATFSDLNLCDKQKDFQRSCLELCISSTTPLKLLDFACGWKTCGCIRDALTVSLEEGAFKIKCVMHVIDLKLSLDMYYHIEMILS
jgi:hypothetical protein